MLDVKVDWGALVVELRYFLLVAALLLFLRLRPWRPLVMWLRGRRG